MRLSRLLALSAVTLPLSISTLFLSGCSTPAPNGGQGGLDSDPCVSVSCGDHGHCASNAGTAECVCDSGFTAQGLSCVAENEESAPCDGVSCGDNGHCAANGTVPECVCDSGFVTQGLSCVAQTASDPCASNPCSATGKTCSGTTGGVAVCACPSGFADQGNGCVQLSACAVNPCTGTNKTVCYETGGTASCLCNPGYEPLGATCTAILSGDGGCPSHSGGPADDSFEPDECPSLSQLYSTAQAHKLSAADVDWLHFSVAASRIVQVTFTGSTVPLYVDVFASDATTPVSASHSGVTNPSLRFLSGAGGAVFVRVKANVPVDTTNYTVTVSDLGADDFPNSAATASTAAGSTFNGSLQYVDDEDFVKLSALAGHSYRFTMSSSTATGIAVELYDFNGTTLMKTLDETISANTSHTTRPRTAGTYLFRAKALNPGVTGSFSVSLSDQGLDDRGDTLSEADAISVTPSTLNGSFERSDDNDVFTFAVLANHTYRFNCTQGTRGCIMSMRDSSGNVLAQQINTFSSITSISAMSTAAGTWNVSVAPYSGSGSYTYQLEDLGGDDYSNTYQLPHAITLGTAVHGSIEVAADHDVFGFPAISGQLYRVTCGSPVSNLCALVVRNAGGTSVATSPPGSNRDVLLRAATGGTFTVDMATGGQTGLYTITVSAAGTDDYADTSPGATAVSLGATTAGAIDFQGDLDFFSFSTTAGHIYRIACADSYAVCGLKAYDPTGALVGDSSGYSANLGVLSTSGGVYKLSIGGYPSYSTGSYTVTITDVGTDDHPNTTAGAATLTLGSPTSGDVQYGGDKDLFTFSATATRLYRIVCDGAVGVCNVTLRDAGGTTVSTASATGTTVTINFKAASSQVFSVQLNDYHAGYVGAYQLTVSDQGLDDFGDTVATATPYTLGSPATVGRVDFPNDLDVFSFTSVANHVYRINCTSSSYAFCEQVIRNSVGATVVSSNNGTSTTTQFYAATAQTYSVELSPATSAVGTYTFQVVDEGADDWVNTSAGSTLITTGATGNIQYSGDKDVFRFAVTAGKVYTLQLAVGGNLGVTVKDPVGATVKVGYGAVGFAAATSATYSVEVAGISFGAQSGEFTLTIVEATDDAPETAAGAPSLTLGNTRNAGIDYLGDEDVFSVALTGGTAYSMVTTGLGVYISVIQPDGATQASGLSYQTKGFTPTSSGTYFVKISNASGMGAYTLKVQ